MTDTTNSHEDAARARKAARLIDAIHRANNDADRPFHAEPTQLVELVEKAGDGWWTALANYVGCRPPSPATRAMVITIMRGALTTAADPFDGIAAT